MDKSHYEKTEPFTTKYLSIKLYHNSNLNFLVYLIYFDFASSTWRKFYGWSILGKGFSMLFMFSRYTILNSERELNWLSFF